MSVDELYDRIWANCCTESGLSQHELEAHVLSIVRVILEAKGLA